MEDKKLVVSARKYKGESSVVSLRLPCDLVKDIDAVANKTGRTRNEIIAKSLEFALENLEIID